MFDKLFKAAVGVATLPIDIVADTITMGGVLNDKDEPHTVSKAKSIMKNIEESCE